MAEDLIAIDVFPREMTFKPGGMPAVFHVKVANASDRFASFQVDVLAAGVNSTARADWYNLSPEVSTLQPPGKSTQFRIAITDTPVPGFVGLMNLTVRVYSIDLPGAENRQILRLTLEPGTTSIPLKLSFPVNAFSVYPDDQVEIPLQIYNPGQIPTQVVLKLVGIDSAWMLNGVEHQLALPADGRAEISFLCQPPPGPEAPSRVYPFTIEATHTTGPPASVTGSLDVLPVGFVDFDCQPRRHQIPARRAWLPGQRAQPVTYKLLFENRSNLHQQVSAKVQGDDQQHCTLELIPDEAELPPQETTQLSLTGQSQRPWFGRAKRLLLPVGAVTADRRLDIRNDTQTLELWVQPLIPTWLLVGGGLLLLWLVYWFSGLNPAHSRHDAAVNSVQFNGLVEDIVSGSDDQTLIEWRVEGFHPLNFLINPKIRRLGQAGKAVRVTRYRPVNNNQVAAGLENGEIQLWNLLGEGSQMHDRFYYRRDDRVLALAFTDSSHYLFSGHGSGLALQWDVKYDTLDPSGPPRLCAGEAVLTEQRNSRLRGICQLDFAIYDLRLIGQDDESLAIAGQYNQLVVWNWANNTLRSVQYPRPGGQEDYIFSIDSPARRPHLLVTADAQGYITVLDLQTCLNQGVEPCGEVIDTWSSSQQGKPVRSVSLSSRGCYLASAGDDGRMMLWPLTAEGRRANEFSTGKVVGQSTGNRTINSIDVKVARKHVLVVSGGNDRHVRVVWEQQQPQVGCSEHQ